MKLQTKKIISRNTQINTQKPTSTLLQKDDAYGYEINMKTLKRSDT